MVSRTIVRNAPQGLWPLTCVAPSAVQLLAIVLLSRGALAGKVQDPPQQIGDLALIGQVLDAQSKQPVGGATVELRSSLGPTGPRVLTDASGRFVFFHLAAEAYTIRTTAPGYSPSSFGQGHPWDPAARIELARSPGRTVQVLMWKLASVSGQVVDAAGAPALGIGVIAVPLALQGSPGVTRYAAKTDTDGRYRIGELPPGGFIVGIPFEIITNGTSGRADSGARGAEAPEGDSASAAVAQMRRTGGRTTSALASLEGQRLWVHPSVFFSGSPTLSDAMVIGLRPGEARESIDFRVVDVPGWSVHGRIKGPPGLMEQVSVSLCGVESKRMPGPGAIACASRTYTRPGESFTLWGVPAGAYWLRAELVSQARIPSSISAGDASYFASSTLRVDEDVRNLVLELDQGPSIRGRVIWDGGLHPTEGPVSVSMNPAEPWPLDGVGSRSTVSVAMENDRFRTPHVRPGRYLFQVRAPEAWVLSAIRARGRILPGHTVDVQTDLDDLALVMTRAGTVTAHIQGDIPSDAVARLLIFPAGPWDWSRAYEDPLRVREILWPSNGSVQVTDLPAGDYHAAAMLETDFDYRWRDFSRHDRLTGRAIRFTNGAAASEYAVATFPVDPALWVMPSHRVALAHVADDGSFELIGLPPGEYFVGAIGADDPNDLGADVFQAMASVGYRVTLARGESRNIALSIALGREIQR